MVVMHHGAVKPSLGSCSVTDHEQTRGPVWLSACPAFGSLLCRRRRSGTVASMTNSRLRWAESMVRAVKEHLNA